MSAFQTIFFSFIVFFLCNIFSSSSIADKNQKSALLPLEELIYFTQAFEKIREEYVEEVNDKELLEMSIEGLLDALDPHSSYLDKTAFALLEEKSSGEFEGLGVYLNQKKGALKVISPIDGSPAYKAGILSGDLIIKINNISVQSMSSSEVIEAMKGPKESVLTLTILRDSLDGPIEINIKRDVFEINSVRSKPLRPGFSYIRIAQFHKNTGKQFKEALESLYKTDELPKGLVLDLRNNPGGLLTASIEVIDTILDEGLIVYTEGRTPRSNKNFYASPGDSLNGVPIVVLINEGSASAAEIVAGALQDHRRALILGTNSFGKGSVQTIFPLGDDRGIKLTTARYFTPNKTSIQASGIKPDIRIEPAEVKIRENISYTKEENLLGHLSKPLDNKNGKVMKTVIKDNQLNDALNILQGLYLLSNKLEPVLIP
tara:strand:- start:2022 stop:3311 length:1290 start_codon:yes stop_codon:yes gene_type:complete